MKRDMQISREGQKKWIKFTEELPGLLEDFNKNRLILINIKNDKLVINCNQTKFTLTL